MKNNGLQEDSIEVPKKVKEIQKSIHKQKNQGKVKVTTQDPPQELIEAEQKSIEDLKRELALLQNQAEPRMQQSQQKKQNGVPWGKRPQIQTQEPPQPAYIAQQMQSIQQPKPNGQHKPVSSTIEIIQKLEGNRPFVTTAQKYGTAIAASILAKTEGTPGARLNFEDQAKTTIQLVGGSYGLIYKNGTPMRLAPYTWSLDQQTRRTWAVFMFNDFYGHKNPSPWKIWKTISKPIVLTPVSHTTNMADGYGKGYLTKFDEGTQFQQALSITDDKMIEEMRSENKHFLSSALTLWMDLQSYTKPKINIKLILIVFAVAAVAIVAFYIFKTHPNLLSNILPGA